MAKVLLTNFYEPEYLGLRFLASYLLKHGHQPHLLHLKNHTTFYYSNYIEEYYKDKLPENNYSKGVQLVKNGCFVRRSNIAKPFTKKELELYFENIVEQAPDILGISSRSIFNYLMPDIIPRIKELLPNTLIVAGGFGPVLDIEFYLSLGIDIVIRGEGEETLEEIASCMDKAKADKTKAWKDCTQILNCAYLENGKIIENKMRPQVKDLDLYGAPLYGNEYCTFIENNTIKRNFDFVKASHVYFPVISRGCLGKCTYCSGSYWYDQYKKDNNKIYRMRTRSLDKVLDELRELDKKQYTFLNFMDEMFTAPIEEMKEFYRNYKKDVNIPFFQFFLYEHILNNEELFQLIADAGWASTGVGVQTTSKKMIAIYGRESKEDTYLNYINKLVDNNIKVAVQTIGGDCYETEEDFEATLDFIKKLPNNIATYSHLYIQNTRLMLFPKAPILELQPKVLTNPLPEKEWAYRAALTQCRRLMDDEMFEEVRKQKLYKDEPDLLLHLYRGIRTKRHLEYFEDLAQKYKGKDIIFCGTGEIYEDSKETFKDCNAIAMLVDTDFMKIGDNKTIDNMPILPLNGIHNLPKDAPIISLASFAVQMQRKLERIYNIEKGRFHACGYSLSWDKRKKSPNINL